IARESLVDSSSARLSGSRVRAVGELTIVVTLRSHDARERTPRSITILQTIDDLPKVVARLPTHVASRPIVHVHTLDGGQHLPTTPSIFLDVLRHAPLHHARCVHPQLREIVGLK